jgi:hypothetical protein
MKKVNILLAVISIAVLMVSCSSTRQAASSKDDVVVVEGLIELHPLSITVETTKDTFYCLISVNAKTMFITPEQRMYDSIAAHLPIQLDPEKIAIMQGSQINPLTQFTPEEFAKIETKFKKLGIELNKYKVARASGVGLTTWTDYQKLVEQRNQRTQQPGTYGSARDVIVPNDR